MAKIKEIDMFAPTHDGEQERIVAIEYHRAKAGWKPFSVVTDGGCIFDFEWCEQDGVLAHHMSGCGSIWGKVYTVCKYCDAPKLCSKLWYDRSCMTLKSNDEKPLNDKQVRAMGIQVVKEPLGGNPFGDPDAVEGDVEYCNQCRSHHPSDDMCCHVQWQESGGGWFLGCGASDVDFGETQASLYRLLRSLPPKIVHGMLKDALSRVPPIGGEFDRLNIIDDQHRAGERFWPGIAWLRSLDKKCKEALALTAGWLWMFELAKWDACEIVPKHQFIWHMSIAKLDEWLAINPLDLNELRDRPLRVRLGFKPQCANDFAFLKNPLACEEVTLWPPRNVKGKVVLEKSLTLSVAEVKWVGCCQKAVDIYFGAVIERNGKHISEHDGYETIY